MKNTRVPTKITLDAYAASHRAVREMKEDGELPGRVKVRSSQYLNNLVEQDHRRVKQRIRPMLGFKRFDNAVVTISGIELAEKIKKGQTKEITEPDESVQPPRRSAQIIDLVALLRKSLDQGAPGRKPGARRVSSVKRSSKANHGTLPATPARVKAGARSKSA
jgi:hypothetical protein